MEKPHSFLSSKTINDGPITECAITNLNHLGLIKVSGKDKFDFLQGQLTNDIKKVSETQSQLSSYCTHKGRILASFRVFQRDDDIFFILPTELVDSTIQRLSMFVLRSDVKITNFSPELEKFEVSGKCAEDFFSIKLPDSKNIALSQNGHTIISIPGDRPRFLIITNEKDPKIFSEKAKEALIPTSKRSWALLDIRAGLPNIYEKNKEAFIPQMVNFQIIDGVSFSKGCYTGQEVVARMHYLGKTKRRMYRARIDANEIPNPGDDLFSKKGRSGQGAGKIVDASPSPDGGFEILIVAPIANVEANDLFLSKESENALQILELPYSLETE